MDSSHACSILTQAKPLQCEKVLDFVGRTRRRLEDLFGYCDDRLLAYNMAQHAEQNKEYGLNVETCIRHLCMLAPFVNTEEYSQ